MEFIINLLDLPICWKSKSQKGVTLSSTEAKYVAISEAVKEFKFVYHLMRDLQIIVNLPIELRMDNLGAVFVSENALTCFCNRHMDTCYPFVQEFIEDGFIKIEFVRSAENYYDSSSKNVMLGVI
jgi:hypothetical protein